MQGSVKYARHGSRNHECDSHERGSHGYGRMSMVVMTGHECGSHECGSHERDNHGYGRMSIITMGGVVMVCMGGVVMVRHRNGNRFGRSNLFHNS